MIDTHVHFWNYNKVKDAWITDDMKMLQRDFLPQHLKPLLQKNEINGIVAVQADQSELENKFLVELAKKNSEIEGIVAWVDLKAPDVEERLHFYSQASIIKGFRHIVQAEPEGFLRNEKFLRGVGLLSSFHFTYDVLIYHHQLREALDFVSKFPGQKFIIDHCAKPDIKNKKITEWKTLMDEMAKNKNVYCKLSGLTTETVWNKWSGKDFYPYLDTVMESFGPERLLFGSDWPVMLLSGTYDKWKMLIENYIRQFAKADKENIFRNNAIRFYNIFREAIN